MEKNKLGSLILSLALAFGLWLYVVTSVSQQADWTFDNIQVVREGESVLNEKNLMITDISAKAVSLTISGARDDLNNLSSDNTSVKIDLSKINEPGTYDLNYAPSYPTTVGSNDVTVTNKTPGQIQVSVDYRRTYEVPVRVKWTGTRSENYLYDTENCILDYPVITINGPAAVADRIDHALVEVDLTGRSESVSESFRYTLCDKEGKGVDAASISTNVEEVRLSLQIQRIKELKLVAEVIYGGGATEDNTTITINPAVIRVSGGDAVLAELGDSLTICSINLADMEKTGANPKYTITLPEGVTNQTGVTEATVSVRISGLKTREFTIENFEMINIPEGLAAEIINAGLTVKVRGPEPEISALTAENITAVVDFSAAEIGTATYKATIVFGEGFGNVGALKTSSVSATVQQAPAEE